MKTIINTIIILVLSVTTVNAQMTDEQLQSFIKSANKKELVQKNTFLMLEGYYQQSIVIAEELLKQENDNANFNYRMGFAVFNSTSDFQKAIPYFEKAKQKTDVNTDVMSAKETSAPLEVFHYLGRSYHLTNKLEKAKELYQQYLDSDSKDDEMKARTALMLKQCKNAETFFETPRKYEIINLGEGINTEYPDYAPIISLDGSVLYFTSRRLRKDGSNKHIKEPVNNLYNEDVYRSIRKDIDKWEEPEVMEFSLPERNEATVAVSADERSFYIYKDDAGNGDIFETQYKDQQFENLKPIELNGVNTDAWEPHITSSADGRYKYFSSDREGGFGGRDIYRITKLPNGEWSQPMNLGPTINTPYDEDSPFISIDNKTLYFSHNGEKSIGGFDVFVSVLNPEDQSWSDPINLGVPLNSTGDDIYYTTTADGLTGYYTSFRPDGYGEKDIYEVRNDYLGIENATVLVGNVIASNGEKLPEDISFTINCLNCGIASSRDINLRPSDGGFFVTLQKCKEYEMIFHNEDGNNQFHRETFKTDCENGFDKTEKSIVINLDNMTVEKNKEDEPKEELPFVYAPLEIKHYFGYNNNKLDPQKDGLKVMFNEILEQAEKGRKTFEITVNSSASKVPTKTYKNNMNLANLRAENVSKMLQKFIAEHEILKNKITVKINEVGVNGPAYKYGTHLQQERYAPYQYVIIQLQGEKEGKTKVIKSKDKELKNMPSLD
ncbi:hypothetical protein CW751_09940 [Brumimicrobium salinarum]|uniref:Uncharacterized protein n=1 Tax=Brumimicrobium salinarum TaxID=2058658 RepID=A0A2I0R1C7_9FLAO|nr:PD40 domain-containing protein [Brumimicrobium salinarum]PKR80384.1 hypothetical protein CW751_09940 [Brumimicrobium salinarum]